MKPVLREFLLFVVFLAGWYAAAIGLSYAFYPNSTTGIIVDTDEARNTIFATPQRRIVWGLSGVASSDKKKIFLIGSSNVREAFRPKEIEAVMPDYEVHNMGLSASNITQARDTVDLIRLLPEPAVKNSVFVVGIWYGSFVDDKTRWNGSESDIVQEAVRYGLYKRDNGKLVSAVDMEYFSFLALAVRPSLLLQAWSIPAYLFADNAKTFFHNMLRERRLDFAVFLNKRPVIAMDGEEYRGRALKGWDNYMNDRNGVLKEEQFEKLLGLCRAIDESGAKLVIVDMPLPGWHREGSRFYANYQKVKAPYISSIKDLRNASYIDMQEALADSDFRDSAHPAGQAAGYLSLLLKEGIRKIE